MILVLYERGGRKFKELNCASIKMRHARCADPELHAPSLLRHVSRKFVPPKTFYDHSNRVELVAINSTRVLYCVLRARRV